MCGELADFDLWLQYTYVQGWCIHVHGLTRWTSLEKRTDCSLYFTKTDQMPPFHHNLPTLSPSNATRPLIANPTDSSVFKPVHTPHPIINTGVTYLFSFHPARTRLGPIYPHSVYVPIPVPISNLAIHNFSPSTTAHKTVLVVAHLQSWSSKLLKFRSMLGGQCSFRSWRKLMIQPFSEQTFPLI